MSKAVAHRPKRASYPAYRDSGIEWLGEVPKHWDMLALKRQFRVVNGGTPSTAEDAFWDGDITWVTPEDLGRNDSKYIAGSRRCITRDGLENCGAELVPKSSIIISTRAPIGHVAIANRRVCTNQGCRSLVPLIDVSSDFFYYYLIAAREVLRANGKGTTFTELSAGALGAHAAPIPPVAEQRAIAAFLDSETSKLDTLVAKKRALIKLLKEKRSALISRTVTRGLPPETARAADLDPHPRLKPSGVEWIGEVPEHWEVPPLYARYTLSLGKMLDEKQITGEHLLPYLRNANVRWDFVDTEDLPEMDIEPSQYERFTLKPGDMLVCEGGEVGRTAFWRGELDLCGFQKAVHRLRPRNPARDLPRFLYYVMCGAAQRGVFVAGGNPNTIPHLTGEKLRVYRFAFAPRTEQDAIVAHLDRETAKLDQMIARVGEAIARLQEYRAALITAAVTGKIDVRGEVPKLGTDSSCSTMGTRV